MILNKIKETISQFKLEIGNRVVEDIGEALNITNDKSFEEMFNKERIDDIYATGKAILYVAGTITALGLAIKTATILNTTFTSIKTFVTWITTTGNVALLEFTATIGALIYGINDLNNMDFKNIQDLENLKKENNELENQKELINAVKEDLEKGIVNPDFLLVVDGMDNLKESLKEISMLDPNTDEFNKKLNHYEDMDKSDFNKYRKAMFDICISSLHLLNKSIILNKVFSNCCTKRVLFCNSISSF